MKIIDNIIKETVHRMLLNEFAGVNTKASDYIINFISNDSRCQRYIEDIIRRVKNGTIRITRVRGSASFEMVIRLGLNEYNRNKENRRVVDINPDTINDVSNKLLTMIKNRL